MCGIGGKEDGTLNTTEMYQRMKRVNLINNYIYPYYDTLHTESRENVTENVLQCLLFGKGFYLTDIGHKASGRKLGKAYGSIPKDAKRVMPAKPVNAPA